MTIQIPVSVQAPVYTFRAGDYDVFAGLDVDQRSIAATLSDHDRLMQSLRLPYSATLHDISNPGNGTFRNPLRWWAISL